MFVAERREEEMVLRRGGLNSILVNTEGEERSMMDERIGADVECSLVMS